MKTEKTTRQKAEVEFIETNLQLTTKPFDENYRTTEIKKGNQTKNRRVL